MMEEKHYVRKLSFSELRLDLYPLGEHLTAVLQGGDAPHIGCVVLAEPRESLSGAGTCSCTSSVINRTGHKDEAICRTAAEKLCLKYHTTVCCAGGFHVDNILPEQIREVLDAVQALMAEEG